MKITRLLPLSLFLLLSQHAIAGVSVAEFQGKQKPPAMDTYIAGLADGLKSANSILEAKNTTPLFCLPPLLKLTTANYKEIITLGIKDIPAGTQEKSAMGIDRSLLKKLIELYPCGYN